MGKGRFLATKRAQERVCIVCLALAAILPFLVTSPDIQFWLSAALSIPDGELHVISDETGKLRYKVLIGKTEEFLGMLSKASKSIKNTFS